MRALIREIENAAVFVQARKAAADLARRSTASTPNDRGLRYASCTEKTDHGSESRALSAMGFPLAEELIACQLRKKWKPQE